MLFFNWNRNFLLKTIDDHLIFGTFAGRFGKKQVRLHKEMAKNIFF